MEYLSDFIFGATDGLLATFILVTAWTGVSLSARKMTVIGFSKIVAQGLSMGSSSYFTTKANNYQNNAHSQKPLLTAIIVFFAFVIFGCIPLSIFVFPYFAQTSNDHLLKISYMLIAFSFFIIGMLQAHISHKSVWSEGIKTMWIGCIVAVISYCIESMFNNSKQSF